MIELKGKYNKDCKIFIDEIEPEAYSLIQNILSEKASENVPIRIMPDTHIGTDIVIGFTMPLTNMVNPNHIGVDIGCGMLCSSFKDKIKIPLSELDEKIRECTPIGFNTHKKKEDKIDYKELNNYISLFIKKYNKRFSKCYKMPYINEEYMTKLCRKVNVSKESFNNALGSLGGGNHFIEIGVDLSGKNWITIHTGSRNFGLKVCKYHKEQAKKQKNNSEEYSKELDLIRTNTRNKKDIQNLITELQKKYNIGINKEYLQGDCMFEYCLDMLIAEFYARANRSEILSQILKATNLVCEESISSVHNYIDFDDFIIRKGAIKSYKGMKMIIPFNMRDGILVCEGKGNIDWNQSAPHGAGRIMSRSLAAKSLSMKEFEESMTGIYSTSVCQSTLDESPMAYKDPALIEKLIEPTASVVNKIKPILNIKSS